MSQQRRVEPTDVDTNNSTPVPRPLNRLKGYFDDTDTRVLLGLPESVELQTDGRYGSHDLGHHPVSIALLRDDIRDRRLFPFVPSGFNFENTRVHFNIENYQWGFPKKLRMQLQEDLLNLLIELRRAPPIVSHCVVNYVRDLLPRLMYIEGDVMEPFYFQFQPWFSRPAQRARYARIHRVIALIHAAINLGQRLDSLHKGDVSSSWAKDVPVGIDCDETVAADLPLLQAYAYLGVPIIGAQQPEAPTEYSAETACQTILGRDLSSLSEAREISTAVEGALPADDDDAMWMQAIWGEEFDAINFHAEGIRKTNAERRESPDDEIDDDFGLHLDTNSPASAGPDTLNLPPSATASSTSTSGVTSGSTSSAANSPAPRFEQQLEGNVGKYHHRKETSRSAGHRNKHRGGRKRGQGFALTPRSGSQVAFPATSSVQGQTLHVAHTQQIFRDSNTGAMATAPVVETDFSMLGLHLSSNRHAPYPPSPMRGGRPRRNHRGGNRQRRDDRYDREEGYHHYDEHHSRGYDQMREDPRNSSPYGDPARDWNPQPDQGWSNHAGPSRLAASAPPPQASSSAANWGSSSNADNWGSYSPLPGASAAPPPSPPPKEPSA